MKTTNALPEEWRGRAVLFYLPYNTMPGGCINAYKAGRLAQAQSRELKTLESILESEVRGCLEAGLDRFVLELNTKDAYALIVLDTLFRIRQNNAIEYLLIDSRWRKEWNRYNGEVRPAADHADCFTENLSIRNVNFHEAYREFFGKVYCVLGKKRFQNSAVMRSYQEEGIPVVDLYPMVKPAWIGFSLAENLEDDETYAAMMVERSRLLHRLRGSLKESGDLVSEWNRLDSDLLRYVREFRTAREKV